MPAPQAKLIQCRDLVATGKAQAAVALLQPLARAHPGDADVNMLLCLALGSLSRWDQAADPHTRCKPSGGSRFWHTPYGIEIVDLPETREVIFLHTGAPHSWRIAYLDGRPHPKDLKPSWYGHTTGKWEGDTLVMDTVGFNDKFWLTREGVPTTKQLHLIEKLSRPNHNQLKYEATVDDPGAYTASWTGGWYLRWSQDNEPFDYLCQENNRDPARMVGGQ